MSKSKNEFKNVRRKVKSPKTYFAISIISQSYSTTFQISHPSGIAELRGRFYLMFKHTFDEQKQLMVLEQLQYNNADLRTSVKEFVDHYKTTLPIINKLSDYFKMLRDGEPLYLFPYGKPDGLQHGKVITFLQSVESGEDFLTLWDEVKSTYEQLFHSYYVKSFDWDTRKRIGEPDKKKRVCRFCNNSSIPLAFKKSAHAISEALGNKRIILNEECDACNERFGLGIEHDLIAFCRIHLNMTGIQGKTGVATVKGKNFSLSNKEGIVLNLHDRLQSSTVIGSHRLETNEKISMQNIYRILVKFALSVIETKDVGFFTQTVEWINGNYSAPVLPKIATRIDPELSFRHPEIRIFRRREDDFDLPFLAAEFSVSVRRFVFVVPFSSQDQKDFLREEDHQNFWKLLNHLNTETGWHFEDFSDDRKKELIFNLNFEMAKPDDIGSTDQSGLAAD